MDTFNITFEEHPEGGYAEPWDNTGALLALSRINIMDVHKIEYASDRELAFQFQIEYYFEPPDKSKPRWVKLAIAASGRDYETALQWVVYRVWQIREKAKLHYNNPEEAGLERWY